MIDGRDLADAISDTAACERAIGRLFTDIVRRDRGEAIKLVEIFGPRILAAERQYEAALLDIYDELIRCTRIIS